MWGLGLVFMWSLVMVIRGGVRKNHSWCYNNQSNQLLSSAYKSCMCNIFCVMFACDCLYVCELLAYLTKKNNDE